MNVRGKNRNERPTAEDPRLVAIREFGERLQIKAEKVRLLTRAEEGLGEEEFNPYGTMTLPKETIENLVKIIPGPDTETKAVTSLARQKRRSKQKEKQLGFHRTNINIRDYRPGYTWNKGGRVKEIRIRTIARKFLHLWKTKVFGRVTPSAARAHYNKRILKLTFYTWHSTWWELRKEWRLVIRAECHHRYVLWRKTFRAWQNFIVKQRLINTKKALAEQHCSVKLLRKCLEGWRLYIQNRREKRRKTNLALEHCNQHLTRKCWREWTTRYETILHRQNMQSIALQFWAYRIQAQHWLVWQERMSERRKAVLNQSRAMRHYNTTIVHRCFKALIIYRDGQREKQKEKGYALLLYHRNLVGQMFQRWLEAFRFREDLRERQDRIQQLAESFQKRRMFQHWRHYIILVHEKLQRTVDAEDHYQRKLLSAGLSAFRLSVVQKKLKLMRQAMANQLRYKQMLGWAFNRWLNRCDNNEELRLIGQSRVARQHYRKVLLTRCFHQLQAYTEWRHHRERQYARADAHYYMMAMPEFMDRWKMFVILMKSKRINAENCLEFRRENLSARFFYQWVRQYEFSKEYRMNERMAIIHCDGSAKRSFFNKWKLKTAEAQRMTALEEMAIDHHNGCLLKQHFQAWSGYIQQLKHSTCQAIEAAQYDRRHKLRRVWRAWRQYTVMRREKHRLTERACGHYRRKICGRMVSMWLHYVDTQRLIRERAEVMYAHQCNNRLRELFHTWRDNVQTQIAERKQEKKGATHHNLKVMAKVFTTWHRFSSIHAYKKSETRQLVESARRELDTKMLQVYFTQWHQNYRESVAERVKVTMAVSYHDNRLKQGVMAAWQQYTKESIRRALLQKQSDWFQTVRLSARYFMAWKHAMEEKQLENEKTSLALWHWSLTLNRKVLICWYTYIQQRKLKKGRLADAMERRRCRLLREGVTQWLAVADDLSAMRKQFAAQQQAQGAYKTFQTVLRCGLHWKHWALSRRESRGPIKPRQDPSVVLPSAPSTFRPDNSASTITPRTVTSVCKVPSTPQQVTPRSCVEPVKIPASHPVSGPRSHVPPPKNDIFQASVRCQARARPRRPDFLIESLKKAGLYSLTGQNTDPEKSTSGPAASQPLQLQPQPTQPLEDKGPLHENRTPQTPPGDPTLVERLNLSSMSSARTDDSTVPFQHYTGSTQGIAYTVQDTSNPNSSRSQVVPGQSSSTGSRQIQAGPRTGNQMGHSQTGEPKVHTGSRITGNETGFEVEDYQTGARFVGLSEPAQFGSALQNGPSGHVVNQFSGLSKASVPHTSAKPLLMTPADFTQPRRDNNTANTELYNNLKHYVDNNLTPRTLQEINIHSECQSIASTPRVLCQNSDHGHPLYETFSFKPGEFQGGITPRSTMTTPRDDQIKLSSKGLEIMTCHGSSSKDIHQEIVVIRNRLKSFDQKKKKLRTMQKQLKQLTDWLTDMEVRGHGSDDDDVINAQQEVDELTADIASLQGSVDGEKVKCAGLVDRVKSLMAQIST